MTNIPSAQDKTLASRGRDEIRLWLEQKRFTHFITLAFNDPMVGKQRMRRMLREWDARTNRALLGKRWRKKTDERLNWIAIPEKQNANPHWHLLLQLLPEQYDEFEADMGILGFDGVLGRYWKKLVPSGTIDVQLVETSGVSDYITKQLNHPENFEDFVLFREFFEL